MIIIKDIETELGLSKKVIYQPKEGIYTCYTMDALGYYFIYVPQDDFIKYIDDIVECLILLKLHEIDPYLCMVFFDEEVDDKLAAYIGEVLLSIQRYWVYMYCRKYMFNIYEILVKCVKEYAIHTMREIEEKGIRVEDISDLITITVMDEILKEEVEKGGPDMQYLKKVMAPIISNPLIERIRAFIVENKYNWNSNTLIRFFSLVYGKNYVLFRKTGDGINDPQHYFKLRRIEGNVVHI